jgi:hypothetical protein
VVYCDLEDVDVIYTPEYEGIPSSDLEQDIFKRIELLHRRMYVTEADTYTGGETT